MKKPNPAAHKKKLDRLVSASWQETRAVHLKVFGTCDLPTSPPSKDTCVQALPSLSPSCSLRSVSEAATTFQFRKCLPATFNQNDCWSAYAAKLGEPSQPRTVEFEKAAARAVSLLPKDWDKHYESFVYNTVPSFSSNLEHLTPSQLGEHSAQRFRDICLGLESTIPISEDRDVKILDQGGKPRTITVASIAQLQLAPLHRCLYSALCRTGAILRGPATAQSMRGFTTKPGEVFVSGDYKSSTDNFNLNNTGYLIQLLRATSTRIPESIWDLAATFMTSANLRFGEFSIPQLSGQLMGNYLSFPLLCLTNLAGVCLGLGLKRTKALIKDKCLQINGDDIAFRSSIDEFHTWRDSLPEAGLVLELTKTLVHPIVFTLNSTYFRARSQRKPRLVFFHRASSFTLRPKKEDRQLPACAIRSLVGVALLGAVSSLLAPFHGSPFVERVGYHLLAAHNRLSLPLPLGTLCPKELSVTRLPSRWRKSLLWTTRLTNLRARGSTCSPAPLTGIQRIYRPAKPTPLELTTHSFISQSLQFTRTKTVKVAPMVLPWNDGQELKFHRLAKEQFLTTPPGMKRARHAIPRTPSDGTGIGASKPDFYRLQPPVPLGNTRKTIPFSPLRHLLLPVAITRPASTKDRYCILPESQIPQVQPSLASPGQALLTYR